ncbi:hypothetical protein [Mesobacillus stamsii]|uniref:HNH endonuclease n=1 Tax=Mesobacillus stamsii TaxID=225347 RepID=A0ABU0G0E6_9BACI|nr:hypothetical protein [Mesobacillus stamsii]MDQ0415672.1 hypothetical protein [Mesobacillus stamsii]
MTLGVSHDESRIYFKQEQGSFFGYTDYTHELWKKISSVNWYVSQADIDKGNKTYIYTGSSKFDGYKKLHQVVMIHWYGIEKFTEAYENDFIVEHHDNDAFNCLIENLSFAPNSVNLAKAHTYDKERKEALPLVAINFFKDFTTQKYQITLGFNKDFKIRMKDGTEKGVTVIRLVYNDDFRIVFQDASNLLYNLTKYLKFDLSKLQHIDMEITESKYIFFSNGEEIPAGIEVDGKFVMVLSDHTRLVSVSPNKNLYKKRS